METLKKAILACTVVTFWVALIGAVSGIPTTLRVKILKVYSGTTLTLQDASGNNGPVCTDAGSTFNCTVDGNLIVAGTTTAASLSIQGDLTIDGACAACGDSGTYTAYDFSYGTVACGAPTSETSTFQGGLSCSFNFIATSLQCTASEWVIPANYASGLSFAHVMQQAGAGDGGDAVFYGQASKVPTDSELFVPATAEWTGADATVDIPASYADNERFALSPYTPTGLSLSPGDLVLLSTCRDGADVADTWTGTHEVHGVVISYTANKGY